MPAGCERIIEIANEPFGAGFDVRVIPAVAGEQLDAEFQDYRKARRWATGLRNNHGWRIRDKTGLADAYASRRTSQVDRRSILA